MVVVGVGSPPHLATGRHKLPSPVVIAAVRRETIVDGVAWNRIGQNQSNLNMKAPNGLHRKPPPSKLMSLKESWRTLMKEWWDKKTFFRIHQHDPRSSVSLQLIEPHPTQPNPPQPTEPQPNPIASQVVRRAWELHINPLVVRAAEHVSVLLKVLRGRKNQLVTASLSWAPRWKKEKRTGSDAVPILKAGWKLACLASECLVRMRRGVNELNHLLWVKRDEQCWCSRYVNLPLQIDGGSWGRRNIAPVTTTLDMIVGTFVPVPFLARQC